jgi:alkylation response protein AidB-like acyl-CoA dehydrogenase
MTKFARTQEQALLGETVRDVMEATAPIAEVRRLDGDPTGYSDRTWRYIASELDLAGLLVPESAGGSGGSLADAGVVLEEMGRSLYNGPFLSSSVLAPLILGAATDEVSDLLGAVAAGSVSAVTSIHEGPLVERWQVGITAERAGASWRLSGRATGVLHGWAADHLVVVARSPEGLGVWSVDPADPGHTRRPLTALDLTRAQSEHNFSDVPGRTVIAPERDSATLRRIALMAAVAVSAEQSGGAQHLLERSVEHVVTRYQFGRSLGSFQAIKHRCVDMSLLVEGVISLSRNAFSAVHRSAATDPVDRIEVAAPAAAAYCSESYLQCAGWALQLHGGTGMAWEHDSHLYLRRAKALDRMFGTPADHRRLLIDAVAPAA